MSEVVRRREEYAEATRRAILSVARDLFTDRGYAPTSLDDIADGARVSKGAIYHHFDNKQSVFEAVLIEVDQEFIARISAEIAKAPEDAGDKLTVALTAYLESAIDPVFSRLALQEGPIALGWDRWRKLGRAHIMLHFAELLQIYCGSDLATTGSATLLLQTVIGALHEMASAIAASVDPEQACTEAVAVIKDLVAAVRLTRLESGSVHA